MQVVRVKTRRVFAGAPATGRAGVTVVVSMDSEKRGNLIRVSWAV